MLKFLMRDFFLKIGLTIRISNVVLSSEMKEVQITEKMTSRLSDDSENH